MTAGRRRVPATLPVVVAGLAAFVLVGGALGEPSTARPVAVQVPVQGASAVCPDLRQLDNELSSRVSVGTAPLPDGGTFADGAIRLHANSTPSMVQPVPVLQPGQVVVGLGATLRNDALVLRATGSLSAGLEAEQVTRGERGRERGLAGVRCEAPRTEAWFLGGNTSLGDVTTLVLVNTDDTPSTVDVSVFSASGPADARLGHGLTLNPHSRQVLNLDTLAPDRERLAVHVQSRRGRVAVGLHTSTQVGTLPLGVDWIPQSPPPATTMVVPGFPQLVAGHRVVLINNPGLDDTTVSVQVITADGEFVPAGLDAVAVPAGRTASAVLDGLAQQSALGVRVTSAGGPILAAGWVADRGAVAGEVAGEFAYTSGSEPLSGPALISDLVINRTTESTLILTAPDGAAAVRITPIRVLGSASPVPPPRVVAIPPGRTVTTRLSTFFPPGAAAILALEVRPEPGSGPVYAARYLAEQGAHGPLTTLLDLRGPAVAVRRLPVVEDPRAAR